MPPPPPPPPPPPGGNMPARPPAVNRGALLGDITKGKQLKKAVTNDRSAPIVGKDSKRPVATAFGAPSVPKPTSGLAPPVPNFNRARSNSDQSGRDSSGPTGLEQPPQLAGIFAGGMPKLKKRGGIDTGANQDSQYTSDPESSRTSAPKPPSIVPPRPAPQLPTNTAPSIPSVANLRKNLTRPNSSASLRGPPPPIGKKPKPAVPGSRKPSAPQVPTFSQAPSFAPPPPSSAPPPPAAPPPPPMAAPRPPVSQAPSSRSQASSSTNGASNSLAMQAAIRAAGQASPGAPPPPPPPPPSNSYKAPTPPQSAPSNPFSVPSQAPPEQVPPSRVSQAPVRSMLDPSSYTLSLNGPTQGPTPNRNSLPSSRIVINDSRWRFQDENMLPKPRNFIGEPKRYRAGRGSSVPLDLSAFN